MTSDRPIAYIYIDGLNFYKRCLSKKPELKWLNLLTMCEILLPTHQISKIRYFTSLVKASERDSEAPQRQAQYLRALQTLAPIVNVHYGRMESSDRIYPLVPKQWDAQGNLIVARVRKIEEKMTDVALGSYMVLDAAKEPADIHVLISSDSDFVPALATVKNHLNGTIGLFSPIEKPSRSLSSVQPLITKIVRRTILLDSQFPETLTDSSGIIQRPLDWT